MFIHTGLYCQEKLKTLYCGYTDIIKEGYNMAQTAVEKDINEWIELTLTVKKIKRNSKNFIEYEKAKEIIRQYYPDYYEKGMKIVREMIGVTVYTPRSSSN